MLSDASEMFFKKKSEDSPKFNCSQNFRFSVSSLRRVQLNGKAGRVFTAEVVVVALGTD